MFTSMKLSSLFSTKGKISDKLNCDPLFSTNKFSSASCGAYDQSHSYKDKRTPESDKNSHILKHL